MRREDRLSCAHNVTHPNYSGSYEASDAILSWVTVGRTATTAGNSVIFG